MPQVPGSISIGLSNPSSLLAAAGLACACVGGLLAWASSLQPRLEAHGAAVIQGLVVDRITADMSKPRTMAGALANCGQGPLSALSFPIVSVDTDIRPQASGTARVIVGRKGCNLAIVVDADLAVYFGFSAFGRAPDHVTLGSYKSNIARKTS